MYIVRNIKVIPLQDETGEYFTGDNEEKLCIDWFVRFLLRRVPAEHMDAYAEKAPRIAQALTAPGHDGIITLKKDDVDWLVDGSKKWRNGQNLVFPLASWVTAFKKYMTDPEIAPEDAREDDADSQH